MNDGAPSPARQRILLELKKAGPITAVELADRLGLTDVAVRQHLAGLEERGYVEAEPLPPQGRGRPSTAWSLTGTGHGVFPERHGELTVDLIEATREAVGESGLDRIIAVRTRKQIAAYRRRIPGTASLKKRVETLAEIRSEEGYMAEVVAEGRGVYLLLEHHCPICDAARVCQGLCRSELEVFRKVLGKGVTVERIAHVLADDARCAYRVS